MMTKLEGESTETLQAYVEELRERHARMQAAAHLCACGMCKLLV